MCGTSDPIYRGKRHVLLVVSLDFCSISSRSQMLELFGLINFASKSMILQCLNT